MNPVEHDLDQINRQLDQRDPPCQNLNELRRGNLRRAIEFIHKNKLQRVVQGICHRVNELGGGGGGA